MPDKSSKPSKPSKSNIPNKLSALIIDDEPDIRELLEITLSRMDLNVRSAENIKQAESLLLAEEFDLCLTDMRLPDGNGIDFIRFIQQHKPQIPVAMITAHGNMESAIEALKAGAYDFVTKPVNLTALRNLVSTALKLASKNGGTAEADKNELLGKSDAILQTRKTILKLARSQAPVYISGESGVGKELAARLIHKNGPRSEAPFVAVNCGAIPTELMESEFFGHKKGSFTGAVADKIGLFQAAEGGTLFLDEVADLPLPMQVKLLRAIQEKAIRRVGEQKEEPIDVRILSATHKDLPGLTRAGQFRQDLFYRINVIELPMPNLRERPEDIPVLVTHFLKQIAHNWHSEVPAIDDTALQALQAYAFPGNVRELENILERAMTLCDNNIIREKDLNLATTTATALTDGEGTGAASSGDKMAGDDMTDEEIPGLDSGVSSKQREMIEKALHKTRYNKTAAAKLLGITLRQLRYRMQKLDIK